MTEHQTLATLLEQGNPEPIHDLCGDLQSPFKYLAWSNPNKVAVEEFHSHLAVGQ